MKLCYYKSIVRIVFSAVLSIFNIGINDALTIIILRTNQEGGNSYE